MVSNQVVLVTEPCSKELIEAVSKNESLMTLVHVGDSTNSIFKFTKNMIFISVLYKPLISHVHVP